MKSSYIWERFGWLFFTPKLFIKRRFFKNTSHACNTFQYTCFLVFNFALFCCFLFLFPSFIFVSFLVAINFLGVSFYLSKRKKQNKTKQILFQLLKSIHTSALFSFSADDFIANRCLKLLHFVLNQTSFSWDAIPLQSHRHSSITWSRLSYTRHYRSTRAGVHWKRREWSYK